MASACLQDSDLRQNNIPTVLATAALEHLGRLTRTGDRSLWGNVDARLSTLHDVAVLASVLLNGMYGVTAVGRCTKGIGKHVLVTMGKEGVLWAGPTVQLNFIEPFDGSNDRRGTHKAIEIDEFFSWMHLPALSIEGTTLHNTSGAGDAFVAGVVAHMVRQNTVTNRLRYEAILEGLKAARNHLIKAR